MTTPIRQSEDRVRFQLRRDLEFSDYAIGVGSQLVVKDPLKLEYFLFESFEKTLLSLLHSPLTVFELKSKADKQLSPGYVELGQVRKFLTRLLNDNLVVTDQTGAGKLLLYSNRRTKRQLWLQRVLGILAIRFRGLNPQPMLDALNPITRFFFHPLFLTLSVVAFVIAILTVVLNANRIFATDYLTQNLTDIRTVVAIVFALGVVKIFHELGHALACRSIGRDCHELGVMLLAFVPCLYCNVSDIWMEPDRWKRMLVSAAGIYVEMLIAVICVPLWLLSYNGPVQAFWFAMLTICSVNTLLINGNPLLRYDGYYVLSDWLQIPNLSGVAQKTVAERFRYFFFRGAKKPEAFGFLDLFGVASKLYRIFILGVIIYAVYSIFERIELQRLGMMISFVLFSITFAPAWFRAIRTGLSRDFVSTLKFGRSFAFFVLLLLLAGFVLNLPVTTKTIADGETALASKGVIYAPHEGQLTWLMEAGSIVQPGQTIARITNVQLRIELMQQQQLVAELELALNNQKLLQRQGADNSREVELQKEALVSARRIEQQLLDRMRRLEINAVQAGKLVALPELNVNRQQQIDLTRNTSALLPINQRCSVSRGEPIAAIVDPEQVTVRLRVSEKQIQRVAEGQLAKLLISQSSPNFAFGIVEQIAIDNTDELEQVVETNRKPNDRSVVVVVRLKQVNPANHIQSRVRAAIIGDQIPIYEYCWRLITDNLNL